MSLAAARAAFVLALVVGMLASIAMSATPAWSAIAVMFAIFLGAALERM